jgi:predicted GIY-YIG superfamily endonuclease
LVFIGLLLLIIVPDRSCPKAMPDKSAACAREKEVKAWKSQKKLMQLTQMG